MVFGTFDIFHKGHIDFLIQAKKLGKYLIVVVARDKNVQKIKGKRPQNGERKRLKEIKKSGLADKVIPGNLKNRYSVIKEYKPDMIALGYDQRADLKELKEKLKKFKLLKTGIKRLKAFKPAMYKSSKLAAKS